MVAKTFEKVGVKLGKKNTEIKKQGKKKKKGFC